MRIPTSPYDRISSSAQFPTSSIWLFWKVNKLCCQSWKNKILKCKHQFEFCIQAFIGGGIVTKQLTFQRGWENQPSYILTPINKTTTKFPWSSTTVLRWGLTTSRKSQFLPSVSTPRYHNNKVKTNLDSKFK